VPVHREILVFKVLKVIRVLVPREIRVL